jgi:FkbM family methyltransferase
MGDVVSEDILECKFGNIRLLVRKSEIFVFYATFIVDEYYKLHLKPGDTVIDFGANVGDFTLKAYSRLNGNGRIIAVEPCHENIKILKANLEINNIKNVEIYEYAISDIDGFVYLNGGGSVGSKISLENAGENERVKAYSMDRFLEETGLNDKKNIVVKMDIEGAEEFAFKSRNFVENIREISIELHGRRNIETIPKILSNNGFVISEFTTIDEVKQTIKNIFSHPIDFAKIERKSNFLGLKGAIQSIYSKNPVPSINNLEFKIIYASRKI